MSNYPHQTILPTDLDNALALAERSPFDVEALRTAECMCYDQAMAIQGFYPISDPIADVLYHAFMDLDGAFTTYRTRLREDESKRDRGAAWLSVIGKIEGVRVMCEDLAARSEFFAEVQV